jgi:ATP-dependent RNA helicase DDX21
MQKKLIEEKGAETALSLCLAVISGYTQPISKRSLLSSTLGYTTVTVNCAYELNGEYDVIRILRNYLRYNDVKNAKEIRLFKGGAVVDLPERVAELLCKDDYKNKKDPDISFEICKELPEEVELTKKNQSGYGSRGGRGGNFGGRGSFSGRGNFGGRGSFSGRGNFGGRGSFSGRGGFRGRGGSVRSDHRNGFSGRGASRGSSRGRGNSRGRGISRGRGGFN